MSAAEVAGRFLFHATRAADGGLDVRVRGAAGAVAVTTHIRHGHAVIPSDEELDSGAIAALEFVLLIRSVVRNRPVTLTVGVERREWAPVEAIRELAARLPTHPGFESWDLSDPDMVRLAARFASGSWTVGQLTAWGLVPGLALRITTGSVRPRTPDLPRAAISIAMLSRMAPTDRVVEVHPDGWVRTHRITADRGAERWYGGFDVVDLLARLRTFPPSTLVLPQDASLLGSHVMGRLRQRVAGCTLEDDPRTTSDLRLDIERRVELIGGAW